MYCLQAMWGSMLRHAFLPYICWFSTRFAPPKPLQLKQKNERMEAEGRHDMILTWQSVSTADSAKRVVQSMLSSNHQMLNMLRKREKSYCTTRYVIHLILVVESCLTLSRRSFLRTETSGNQSWRRWREQTLLTDRIFLTRYPVHTKQSVYVSQAIDVHQDCIFLRILFRTIQ